MYEKLVNSLRTCSYGTSEDCKLCSFYDEEDFATCNDKLMVTAADTIEELIAKLNHADAQIVSLVDAAEERRWIPVTERLPDDRTDVVAVCKGGAFAQLQWTELAFYCIKEDGTAEFFGIDKSVTNARVTHWMPLPEPPKGEAE